MKPDENGKADTVFYSCRNETAQANRAAFYGNRLILYLVGRRYKR